MLPCQAEPVERVGREMGRHEIHLAARRRRMRRRAQTAAHHHLPGAHPRVGTGVMMNRAERIAVGAIAVRTVAQHPCPRDARPALHLPPPKLPRRCHVLRVLFEREGTLVVEPFLFARELLDARVVGECKLRAHEPLLAQRAAAEVRCEHRQQRRERVVAHQRDGDVGGVMESDEVASLEVVHEVLNKDHGDKREEGWAEDHHPDVADQRQADVHRRADHDLDHELGYQSARAVGWRPREPWLIVGDVFHVDGPAEEKEAADGRDAYEEDKSPLRVQPSVQAAARRYE